SEQTLPIYATSLRHHGAENFRRHPKDQGARSQDAQSLCELQPQKAPAIRQRVRCANQFHPRSLSKSCYRPGAAQTSLALIAVRNCRRNLDRSRETVLLASLSPQAFHLLKVILYLLESHPVRLPSIHIRSASGREPSCE